jgi:hypothetical protein
MTSHDAPSSYFASATTGSIKNLNGVMLLMAELFVSLLMEFFMPNALILFARKHAARGHV